MPSEKTSYKRKCGKEIGHIGDQRRGTYLVHPFRLMCRSVFSTYLVWAKGSVPIRPRQEYTHQLKTDTVLTLPCYRAGPIDTVPALSCYQTMEQGDVRGLIKDGDGRAVARGCRSAAKGGWGQRERVGERKWVGHGHVAKACGRQQRVA